jgi:hypothetical protein
MDQIQEKLKLAAKEIKEADALFITAGAGMGVDSGLPDFRGNSGFWKPTLQLQNWAFLLAIWQILYGSIEILKWRGHFMVIA